MYILNDYTLDPQVWFADRRLTFEPKHFTRAKTKLTARSLDWITNNLTGRYCIGNFGEFDSMEFIFSSGSESLGLSAPSFEDPSEATLYELTWS